MSAATRTYKKLLADEKVRAIGVSNFTPGHLDDDTITKIAAAHGKTPAQVMLRWHLQRGRSAIPKSTKPQRIAENFDVCGFDLTDAELAAVDSLDQGVRRGPEPGDITLETFGREIPEA